jgi:prevent-host-death family protein
MIPILDQTSQNAYAGPMEKFVSVYDFKSKLSEHLGLVEEGDELVVTRNGKPIAKVVPYLQPKLKLGALREEFAGWEDFDFDAIDWFEVFPEWKASLFGEDK